MDNQIYQTGKEIDTDLTDYKLSDLPVAEHPQEVE